MIGEGGIRTCFHDRWCDVSVSPPTAKPIGHDKDIHMKRLTIKLGGRVD